MGSWRRRHQGQAEIRRAYAPHYELTIAKRSLTRRSKIPSAEMRQNSGVNGLDLFAAIMVRRQATDIMESGTDARQS